MAHNPEVSHYGNLNIPEKKPQFINYLLAKKAFGPKKGKSKTTTKESPNEGYVPLGPNTRGSSSPRAPKPPRPNLPSGPKK